MLTATRAVIVAMPLFNVLLIIYGIYRLNRPSTRHIPLFLKLFAWLLTRVDLNDLRPPPEAAPLQRRQQYLFASQALGAGICGLVLASICIAFGQAASIPYFPWSNPETVTLLRQLVIVGLGLGGEVAGMSIGGGIGQVVGSARLSQVASAQLASNDVRPRYADLVSPLLHVSLWIMPVANVLLVGAMFALIGQQPDMGLSRTVVMLWPLAIPPLLLILQTLATELSARQRHIPIQVPPTDSGSESHRELIEQISIVQREFDLKQIYDPDMPNLLLYIQMELSSIIVIPLIGPQLPVIALFFAPLGLIVISRLITYRFLHARYVASLQSLQSAIPLTVPWRWRSPDAR